MEKFIVILITASLGITYPKAEGNRTKNITVTISSAVANQYLFLGTGTMVSESPVIQTDLLISHESGLYLNLWNSRSLKGNWNDGSFGNEIDYGLGWYREEKSFSVNVGVSFFDNYPSFTFGEGDILYSYASLGKDFKHLSLTLGYENLTPMSGSNFPGGNLMRLTASKTFSLWQGKFVFPVSLSYVYNTGIFGEDEEFFLKGNAGINWNITDRITANMISVNYFLRERENAMVSSGVTFNF